MGTRPATQTRAARRTAAVMAALLVASTAAMTPWSPTMAGAETPEATTVLVSTTDGGSAPTAGDSDQPVISASGQYVVFRSTEDLAPGNGPGTDIYRRDLFSDEVVTVSRPAAGGAANGASSDADLSGDGHTVVFVSEASNLVPGDTNGVADVFVADLLAGTVTRIMTYVGAQPNGASSSPSISDSGRYVAFTSEATNLELGDTEPGRDIFRVDRDPNGDGVFDETPTLILITESRRCGGAGRRPWTHRDDHPDVSSNGRVSFSTWNDLTVSSCPGDAHMERQTPIVVVYYGEGSGPRQPLSSFTVLSSDSSSLSDDGTRVTYEATTSGLPDSGDDFRQILSSPVTIDPFAQPETTWISAPATGAANGDSVAPRFSADRQTIVFTSDATNLTGAAGPARDAVYAWAAGGTERVSVRADGSLTAGASEGSFEASVSGGGQTVVMTAAEPLVTPDENSGRDVVARVRGTNPLAISLLDTPQTLAPAFRIDIAAIPPTVLQLFTSLLSSTPLSRIDLTDSPLSRIPLSRIPLSRIGLEDSPLSRIPLSRIPLSRIGGWGDALVGTPFENLPLEAITLDQVLAYIDANPGSPLATITLAELDLRDSPLSRIALASLALADLPLSRIPLSTVAADADPGELLAAWCDVVADLGQSCEALGLDLDSTLLSLDLGGISLDDTPLSRIPLSRIPIVDTPLSRIPLSRIVLADTPLSRIPLSRIPLSRIDPAASPLSRIPLSRIPLSRIDAVIDCGLVDCGTATLGDAADAGAIREGATLGDLIGTFGEGDDELVLADLAAWLDDDVLFGDLLLSLINPTDYPWEELPLDALGVQTLESGWWWQGEDRPLAAFVDSGGEDVGALSLTLTLPPRTRLSSSDLELRRPDGTTEALTNPVEQGELVTFHLGELPSGSIVTGTYTLSSTLKIFEQESLTARLASDTHEAIATAGGISAPAFGEEGLDREPDEPYGDPEVWLYPNVLQFGQISSPDDVDYFPIVRPPAGMQTVVSVSALDADIDVGLFQVDTTGSATNSAPSPYGPLPVLEEDTADGGNPGSLTDDVASSLQTPETAGVLTQVATSAHNGHEAEQIIVDSAGDEELYHLKITGYGNKTSDSPYVLRYRYVVPPTEQECAARPLAFPGEGTPGTPDDLAVPADINTLFLVNQGRLGASYGAAESDQTMTALNGLAARHDLGIRGAVLPVDASQSVAAAYDTWDLNPCSVAAANAVVREIQQLTDAVSNSLPGGADQIENIVLVGADDLIPFARVLDTGHHANESSYAANLLNADGGANALSAAASGRQVLTDDPYGDRDPIPWLDRFLYVPDVALGRLVETPAEIRTAIAEFESNAGVLDAATALTTGYDFLEDGASAVDAGLGRRLDPASRQLVNDETWDRDTLAALLTPAGGEVPDVASVNAHYDHSYLLPGAADGTDFTPADLYSTADLVAAGLERFAGKLLFTMGCHGGTSVPDTYVGAHPDRLDWAQAYAGAGAVYVANTGFGYGDTAAVALSERLMALFAERVDGNVSAGQALVDAKQTYMGGLGLYTNYDQKVLMETVFYGLPMYQVGPPTAPEPPVSPPPVLTGGGSVQSASITVTPEFTTATAPDGSDYLVADGEDVQVSDKRPIVPKVTEAITHPQATAHDALIVDLTSSLEDDVLNTIASPVIDSSEAEPAERFDDYAFPARFLNVTTFETSQGRQQQLVALAARVESDGDTDLRERFDQIDAQVFYSEDPDHIAPALTTEGTINGTTATFDVDATDLDEEGNQLAVSRVVVLYELPGSPGQWQPLELSNLGGDEGWRAAASVPPGTTALRWFAQAVDHAGNVGISADRGRMHRVSTLAPSFDAGPDATVVYGDRLVRTIDIADADSRRWTASIDLGSGTMPAEVTGNQVRVDALPATPGTHAATVEVCDDGGACAEETFSLDVVLTAPDTIPPVVTGVPDRAPDGTDGWYRNPVTITWSSTDPDPATGTPTVPAPTLATTEGEAVAYTSDPSCDGAGNCATGSYSVSLDRTAPTSAATNANGLFISLLNGPLKGTASDALSGVGQVRVTFTPTLGGATQVKTATLSCSPDRRSCTWTVAPPALGLFSVTVRATDRAGNQQTAGAARNVLFLL